MGPSAWEELPIDLYEFILKKLPSESDYVRFSLVCKSWNSIAKDNQSKLGMMKAPMLLAYTEKEKTWNLCDITKDEVLDLQLELPSTRVCGFSKGWLITMDEHFVISLINPVKSIRGKRPQENSIIRLPALNLPNISDEKIWSEHPDKYIVKATLSADPISNAKDCIVMVIFKNLCQLAFIRLDKDTRWTCIDAYIRDSEFCLVSEVAYVQNKFYALNMYGGLFSFDPAKFNSKDDVIWITDREISSDIPLYTVRYLVESSDYQKELLMVHRHMRTCGEEGRLTLKFEVSKFDMDKRNWIEIDNIGDNALFIGDNSSISVPTSQNMGCLSNCIYFTHDYDRQVPRDPHRRRDNGVYNIQTKMFLQIEHTHAATLIDMSERTPIWANIKL